MNALRREPQVATRRDTSSIRRLLLLSFKVNKSRKQLREICFTCAICISKIAFGERPQEGNNGRFQPIKTL